MAVEPLAVKAFSPRDGEDLTFEGVCSSGQGLLVRSVGGNGFTDGVKFERVSVEIDGRLVELGPCRYAEDKAVEGYCGRLIPLERIKDLEQTLWDGELTRLRAGLANLPLMLAYRDRVRPEFKTYAADLHYDLSVYQKAYDDLDRLYRGEPAEIREAIQLAFIKSEGRALLDYLDARLDELAAITADYSTEEHERHGYYFRRQLWRFIMASDLIARGNLKPRGYNGDSQMMSLIYNMGHQGDSLFSKLLFKHSVEHPGAQAVRNRRRLIAGGLTDLAGRRPSQDPIRALSVASGAATELFDLFETGDDCGRYRLSLLDQDGQALGEAARHVREIEARLDRSLEVEYLNYSVRTMLIASDLKARREEFDFIYSMGLFDYLTPRVARAVLKKLYQLLKPGGELVVGNFHVSNPSRFYMEYWLDWVLYYRTEEEMLALCDDRWFASGQVFFEDVGAQMFLKLTKD